MSSVAFASALQSGVVLSEPVAQGLVVVLAGGLVGMSIRNMFESIMSEDQGAEPDAGDDFAGDGGGGLMAEEDEQEPADEGADGDDLAGLGGLDDGGEDLDGFEDEGFAGMDEDTDESVAELEHRLDELENEVGSLSSTVNTVRNENEQISESVAEVEENVRKLLDIYEMVTRGVNPFADDVDAGMAGGAMGEEGFGLFADEDAGGTEMLDEDVAEADAEGFFEEDLEEGGEPDADAGDVFEDEEAADPASDDEDFEEFEDADGTSFEDLKEEYESGDDEAIGDEDLEEPDDEPVDEDIEAADDEPIGDEDLEAAEDLMGEVAGGEDAARADPPAEDATRTDAGGRAGPYLASLPDGVTGELLVVEWLEYLVGEAGVREATAAVDYYESIDWIDEDVADGLEDYLAGFDGGGDGSLTIDHHARSLQYIGQLNGGGVDAAALSRAHGGGTDGVQR